MLVPAVLKLWLFCCLGLVFNGIGSSDTVGDVCAYTRTESSLFFGTFPSSLERMLFSFLQYLPQFFVHIYICGEGYKYCKIKF